MPRFVVIAGPANSGKMPLAAVLVKYDPTLVLVHRDLLREALARPDLAEGVLTLVMVDLARSLLACGQGVVACAWNLEPEDRQRWEDVARDYAVAMEWMDTRSVAIQALIPPLEGWVPKKFPEGA